MGFPVRFPTHEELGRRLREIAERYPTLVSLEVAGRSHRNREIWLVTLTDTAAGAAANKPALYMDGNIHAEELTAGAAVLHFIEQMTARYSSDPEVRSLLRRRAFYLIPMADPDGATVVHTSPHPWCGNGVFTPPLVPERGLYYLDVDGDGYILFMRRRDPDGEWKTSARDPRLMVPRDPEERGGTYYRLYPEGRIANWDGGAVTIPQPQDGNLNRNFPADWDPDEYGGSAAPLIEPEARAIVETVLSRPNIGAALACHTHSGVLLAPESPSESPVPYEDQALYEALNRMGERLTGWPAISVLKEFTAPGVRRRHGVFDDWAYNHRGLISYTIELWDPYREAGIPPHERKHFHPLTEEQQLKLLAWNDAVLGGGGFVDWKPFDHPELGPVEIGGWKYIEVFRNCPTDDYLNADVERVLRFAAAVAETLPEVHLRRADARRIADDLFIVDAVIANRGFCPTGVTAIGQKRGEALRVELGLEPGMELLMGEAGRTVGPIAGRVERPLPWNPWVRQWTPDAARVEWLIRAPKGGSLTVRARGGRAGRDETTISLDTTRGARA
jgi:hypothetical protein